MIAFMRAVVSKKEKNKKCVNEKKNFCEVKLSN